MAINRLPIWLMAGTSAVCTSGVASAQATGTPLSVPQQEQEAKQTPPPDTRTQSIPPGQTPKPAGNQPTAASTGEIVVTAERRGERVRDVPISIDVQTAASLQAANISTLREISAVSPGVNFTQSGPYMQPTIRGESVDAATISNESPVAIYVDGVYQPVQQANFFELADVSRIEVLKGPQGTLFGRNAAGGAIQIITRDPQFTTEGLAAVTGGLFSTRGGEIGGKGFVTGPIIDNTLAFSLSGLYSHTAGYYKNVVTDKRVGNIDTGMIRGKLLFKPTSWLRFIPTAFWYKRMDRSTFQFFPLAPFPFTLAGPHPTKPYETGVDAPSLANLQSWGVSLRAEADLLGGTLTSTTAYTDIKSKITADGDATSFPAAAYLLDTPDKSFQQEAIYASPQIGPVRFVAGVFYFNSRDWYQPLEVGPTVNSATPYAVIFAKTHTFSLAEFGEVNVNLTDQLIATAGIRHSWERRTYDGGFGTPNLVRLGRKSWRAWTPRASLRYEFSPNANVYFTYSQGFKSGLFDATSFNPNPYEPEHVKAYEIGVKAKVTPQLDVTAAIFRNDTKNRQVTANGPNNLTILSNAASSRVEGGELAVNWRSGTGFGLNAAVSYLPKAKYVSFPNASVQAPDLVNGGSFNVVEDLSGTRIQKTPKVQASLLGTYEHDFEWGKLGASANLAYSSSFFYTIGGFIPQKSYAMLNGSLSWSPPSGTYKITAFVKNMTNKAVIQNFVNFGIAYQPPREIGLTGEVRF